jgi:hypothetical protein
MSHYTGAVPDTVRADDWRTQAACLGKWALMHPDNDEHEIATAKAVCAQCPVARQCFYDAVRTGDMQHGIRAGLRPNERREVAKKLQRCGLTPDQVTELPKPRQARAASLADAFARRTERTPDGHLRYTGVNHLQYQGQRYTASQAAFHLFHGRQPQGIVTRSCGREGCVRGDHLLDEVLRDAAARCGTDAGYRRHRRHGEVPCGPCRRAHSTGVDRPVPDWELAS